jgi:trehalose 6-phosphate synthase
MQTGRAIEDSADRVIDLTATTVRAVARAHVLIASNRGPLSFRRDDGGRLVANRGAGGLVSAMTTATAGEDAVWLCASLSDADREVAGSARDGRLDLAGYDTAGAAVLMLQIDEKTLAGAYGTIANETLWLLNHGLIDPASPPAYDDEWRNDWESYVTYNQTFADAICTQAADAARVLVQDYHLTLVPAMVREARPDLRISHFTHTPWAAPEHFDLLPPDVRAAIITGMLGADSIGFHSHRWADDFAECAIRSTGVDRLGYTIRDAGRSVPLRVHPLGVDPAPLRERVDQPDVAERRAVLAELVGDRQVISRVDRTEPAKNIVRGIEAVAELLRRHPEHRDRVVHLAMAYPSRQDLEEYRRYTEQAVAAAAAVNDEFGTDGWDPVVLEVADDYPRSLATLQAADVLLVNPLRDGMNLVAKEGMLLSADAVLVLSAEAGAADEMGADAIVVDPLDVPGTAQALHEALGMPAAERARRHAELCRIAAALPPHEWLEQQLDVLDDLP